MRACDSSRWPSRWPARRSRSPGRPGRAQGDLDAGGEIGGHARPLRQGGCDQGRIGERANVLVIEPGTSAGGAYFVPLAQWIVAAPPGWQVWSVERRENLLEDQSELNLAKRGGRPQRRCSTTTSAGSRTPRSPTHLQGHLGGLRQTLGYERRRRRPAHVITAARRLGGEVVLGGHSLGGGVVTAYATWDFAGRPGADQLAGLVYIDGGSFGHARARRLARAARRSNAPPPRRGSRSAASPRRSPGCSSPPAPRPRCSIRTARRSARTPACCAVRISPPRCR